MNNRVVKSKSERKNKQRRKRQLKKKRKQNSQVGVNKINQFLIPGASANINWKAVNMAANYWSQSRASMIEWQHKHEIAYWKAKAEALSYENNILHSIIQNIYCTNTTEPSHSRKSKSKKAPKNESQLENEFSDMEISEEFLSYLKTSMQHKMELKESKEKSQKIKEEPLESAPPIKPVDEDRTEEMKLLYGKSSMLITGLETKVNLNYDKYKDQNKPEYWPYFPLNPFM